MWVSRAEGTMRLTHLNRELKPRRGDHAAHPHLNRELKPRRVSVVHNSLSVTRPGVHSSFPSRDPGVSSETGLYIYELH